MGDMVGRVEFSGNGFDIGKLMDRWIGELRSEVMKWKATAEEAEAALKLAKKESDYWREQAMGGGDGQSN